MPRKVTREGSPAHNWMLLAEPYDHQLTTAHPFWASSDASSETALEVHIHRGLELGIVMTGCEEIRFGDKVLELHRGDCWLVSMWEPHAWRVKAPDTKAMIVVFLPDMIDEMSADSHLWLGIYEAPPDKRLHTITAHMRTTLLTIAEELDQEIHTKSVGWETSVRLYILRILILLHRQWKTNIRVRRHRGGFQSNILARLMPAMKLVHDYPGTTINPARAAAACNLSASRFHFLFRQTMGLSFGRFNRRARLAYAAHQLLATELTIEDIGQQAGFVDGSHLHHQFIKQYACTPAEYRRRHRDQTPESALIRFTTTIHPSER